MKLRGAIPVTLALLLAAGSLAFASSGAATAAGTPSKASKAPASRAARGKRSSKHSRRRERGQKAPTPERITEIQQALAKDGSFNGKPNGKWDGLTVEAMRKFQAAHGLNATGKLDALTLQKLGLGSTTAGVAAPLPPVSSSSLSSSPAQSTPQL
jgi:peptidoglycan hydrolase-like protein with peptidoglycan-binding domain